MAAKSQPLPEYKFGRLIQQLSSSNSSPSCYEARLAEIDSSTDKEFFLRTRLGPHPVVPLPTERMVRDLTSSTSTAGGDLIYGSLQAVAQAARPALVFDQAGVPRVEVTSVGPVTFPVWNREQSLGGWCAEGVSGASTVGLTVGSVVAMPRSAYSKIRISRRLQLLSSTVEAEVLAEMRRAAAATIEAGFITGDGTESKPLGLLNVPGVSASTWTGSTAPTRANLVAQVEDYVDAHGDLGQARWLASPGLMAAMLTSEVAANSGIFNLAIESARPTILGIPVLFSDSIPDSKLVLFNPQTARTVYWGSPQVQVDRTTYGVQGDVQLLVYNDCDFLVLHPEQITISTANA